MLVSLKWLKELVDVPVSVPELVDRLDLTGTAVESAKSAGAALDNIVVGQIVAKDQHPEADKLWVTKVDVGGEEPLQIVCGAQNFNAGDKVPVAMVGATLPDGMTIKKAKLRGVESRGMNCSARELGLGDDHEGLMILPADAPVGMPFAEYAGLSDTILELEITPNRPDCLSVAGVAREVGAVFDRVASMPALRARRDGRAGCRLGHRDHRRPRDVPALHGAAHPKRQDRAVAGVARRTRERERCALDLQHRRHHQLRDVRARPAAARIRRRSARDRTRAAGSRSAFAARPKGEQLTTLDGQDRTLTADTLLITDPSGPVALAGVMGGRVDRGSRGDRQRPARVRLLQPGLHLAHEPPPRAVLRGILALREGRGPRVVRRRARPRSRADGRALRRRGRARRRRHLPRAAVARELTLRLARLNALLGADISPAEAAAILSRLGCTVAAERRLTRRHSPHVSA